MDKKSELYDQLCMVLTNYESPSDEEHRSSESDLYDMLVKIQNNWEVLCCE